MTALIFDTQSPIAPSDPYRADVACFVGFAGQRDNVPVPDELTRWLVEAGWWSGPFARGTAGAVYDIPIPIETFETFDRLFDWDRRPVHAPEPAGAPAAWTDPRTRVGTTYLGAAVRSFFAQGGRKCYVVSMGPPLPLTARRAARMDALKQIVPGYPDPVNAVSEVDRTSWTGIGHLFGLPDVAMLSVPDLADACGIDEREPRPLEKPPVPEEQFVECSAPVAPPPPPSVARVFDAPRCTSEGYLEWAHALHLVAALVARRRGEVQLVASLPIPADGSPAERDLRGFLTDPGGVLAVRIRQASPGLASAFVQLAYPWARTRVSGRLPEGLEPPEGVLAGLLAQTALTKGAYRSAAGQPTGDAYAVFPEVTRDQLTERRARPGDPSMTGLPLTERVSILGNTPAGLQLLSDVTTSLDEPYRPACVNRLVSLVVRAARIVGEESVFEPSGERLWVELRERLTTLLLQLYRAGALRGANAGEAFSVRCDRSTTSQNDLDAGRVIVDIEIAPAAPIETIRIVLAMDDSGQVSLVAGAARQDAA